VASGDGQADSSRPFKTPPESPWIGQNTLSWARSNRLFHKHFHCKTHVNAPFALAMAHAGDPVCFNAVCLNANPGADFLTVCNRPYVAWTRIFF